MIKKSQRSLMDWTKQKWRTKSGKPSTQGPKATGERYLPEKAIKNLSSAEYAATTRAKRRAKKQGEQYAAQPEALHVRLGDFDELRKEKEKFIRRHDEAHGS